MSLRAAAFGAFKWSLLGEIASRSIGPIVFIALARLLRPEDFGVVAAATVAVSFSQVFWDAGLARALIQRPDDDSAAADAVFWINLGLGIALMLVLMCGAGPLAMFFGDQRIAAVLRVLALQLPLAAVCSVFTALMYRRFAFRQLFWVRLATGAAPGLAAVPLALYGWSYWSLVAGVLTGQVLQLALLRSATRWRIERKIDRAVAVQLLSFGKWSAASGLLGWLYGWLDAIVVGHYLGSHDMGLYRTGNTFVTLTFGLIFSPLLPVLYSLFSRAQYDLSRLRAALAMVVHAIALISVPVGLGLLSARSELAGIVFGQQWSGIGLVIGFLGISHAIGWIAGANGELYRAIGKPQVEAFVMLVMLALYVPTYLLAIRRGLEPFLWARIGLSALALLLHVAVCWRVVGISPLQWLRPCASASFAAAIAAWAANAVRSDDMSDVERGLLMAVAGVVLYGLVIAVFERGFLRRLYLVVHGDRGAISQSDGRIN
jgi:O-antigen/teichoic acid export membrane protein